jgi:hypothetical protein
MAKLVVQLFIYIALYSQNTGSISGYVYDKSNKESLMSVSIYLQNTEIGNITNTEGYFILPKIPTGTYKLITNYIGFSEYSQEIRVKKDENFFIEIYLSENRYQSDVIEVVAEKEKKKIDLLFEKPVSKVELTAAELKIIPQIAESDLLRSLQTLPGIVPVSDYSSAIYVRGGTPDQNLFLIDGADVYNPEHAFGLFSTFNTDAIKNVELSKGGFGADYGGRLSSIMDITNIDGNRNEFQGNASISVLSAKTTLQMPIGENGAISGSIRRTYFDKLLKGTIDDIPDYYFYDGHLKAFYELNPSNKLILSFFGGKDKLDFKFNPDRDDSDGFGYEWGNTTASLKWVKIFSPTLFSNFWITTSKFESEFSLLDDFVTENNEIRDVSLKGYFEYNYDLNWFFKFGFEYKMMRGIFKQSSPNATVDIDRTPKHLSFFTHNVYKPSSNLDIQFGLRYNHFDSDDKKTFTNLSPRLTVKYRATESSNLKFSYGQYFQYLHRIPRAFFSDIWTSSDQHQRESSSKHYIFGYEKAFNETLSLEAETFYKTYNNIYSFNSFTYRKAPDSFQNEKALFTTTKNLFDRGDGNSRGVELLLRKTQGDITGWVAYSFSQTEYKFDDINQERFFSPRHDKPHTINIVGNFDLDRILWNESDDEKWTIGLNYVYSSGQPITLTSSVYASSPTPDQRETGSDINLYPTTINSQRLPAYTRLDLSFNRIVDYDGWKATYYIQFFNIGNRKNVWFIDYIDESKDGKIIQKVETASMFPIIPTLGISIDF